LLAAVLTGCQDNEPVPTGPKRTITVTAGPGGTAAAKSNNAPAAESQAGRTVTLTATPDAGYAFAGWQAVSPATLGFMPNAKANPATFTMPAQAVSVKATFTTALTLAAPATATTLAYNEAASEGGNTVYTFAPPAGWASPRLP
jgi:hypothetical protein